MAVRPLKELLKEAEAFSSKPSAAPSSAPAAPDEIALLTESLLGAESINLEDRGFEKVAQAMNRAEALLQVQALQKIAQFEARALQSGFTAEQVEEAVEKIAAEKLHANLPTLVAVEGGIIPGGDKNSLEKKKVPAHKTGQGLTRPLTRNLGYGL